MVVVAVALVALVSWAGAGRRFTIIQVAGCPGLADDRRTITRAGVARAATIARAVALVVAARAAGTSTTGRMAPPLAAARTPKIVCRWRRWLQCCRNWAP